MKALPELRATYESQFEIINECLEAVAGCDWRFHIDATVPEVLKMSCIHGVDTLDRYTQCSCVVLASKRPDGKWTIVHVEPRHSGHDAKSKKSDKKRKSNPLPTPDDSDDAAPKKSKKRKEKAKAALENEDATVVLPELTEEPEEPVASTSALPSEPVIAPTKKKKRKKSALDTEAAAQAEVAEPVADEVAPPKKKKKQKSRRSDTRPGVPDTSEEAETELSKEPKESRAAKEDAGLAPVKKERHIQDILSTSDEEELASKSRSPPVRLPSPPSAPAVLPTSVPTSLPPAPSVAAALEFPTLITVRRPEPAQLTASTTAVPASATDSVPAGTPAATSAPQTSMKPRFRLPLKAPVTQKAPVTDTATEPATFRKPALAPIGAPMGQRPPPTAAAAPRPSSAILATIAAQRSAPTPAAIPTEPRAQRDHPPRTLPTRPAPPSGAFRRGPHLQAMYDWVLGRPREPLPSVGETIPLAVTLDGAPRRFAVTEVVHGRREVHLQLAD